MGILINILFIVTILAFISFIIASIYFIKSINTPKEKHLIEFFIKTLDGDNLINVEEIEQVTQRYNSNEKQYEIVYYLKSCHELRETFNNGSLCNERFNDINLILNNFNC